MTERNHHQNLETPEQLKDAPHLHTSRPALPWTSAAALFGAIVALSDVLQFLAPIWSWALSAFLLLLIFSCALYFFDRNSHWIVGFALAASALIVPGLVGLKIWQNFVPGASERGLIASQVPAISIFQDKLRSLESGQTAIRQGIAHIDKRTARMASRLEKTKLETSNDPRKELINLGIAWNEHELRNAIRTRDARIVRLFMQSGHRIGDYYIKEFILSRFDVGIAQILRPHYNQIDRKLCTDNFAERLASPQEKAHLLKHQARFFFELCDPRAVTKLFTNRIQRLKSEISSYEERRKNRKVAIANCAKSSKSKYERRIHSDRYYNLTTMWHEIMEDNGDRWKTMDMSDRSNKIAGIRSNLHQRHTYTLDLKLDVMRYVADYACKDAFLETRKPSQNDVERHERVLRLASGYKSMR